MTEIPIPEGSNVSAVLADLDRANAERQAFAAAAMQLREQGQDIARLREELKRAGREIERLSAPPPPLPRFTAETGKKALDFLHSLIGAVEAYTASAETKEKEAKEAAVVKATGENPIPPPKGRRDLSQGWT